MFSSSDSVEKLFVRSIFELLELKNESVNWTDPHGGHSATYGNEVFRMVF